MVRIQRFMGARQMQSEDVRSFATRVQMLAQATMADDGECSDTTLKVKEELLLEQMRSQFVHGLQDRVHRFVMSRDPLTFDDTVRCAVREEANELLSGGLSQVRVLEEQENGAKNDIAELIARLNNIERLLTQREPPGTPYGTRPFRREGSRECFVCGRMGHFARNCDERVQLGKWMAPKNA